MLHQQQSLVLAVGPVARLKLTIVAIAKVDALAAFARDARRQGQLTEVVFSASTESTSAIESVSASTQQISASTTKNLEIARNSLGEMHEIASKINDVFHIRLTPAGAFMPGEMNGLCPCAKECSTD